MKYKVSLKKLIKIVNPFEQRLVSFMDEPLSLNQIKKMIKSNEQLTDRVINSKEYDIYYDVLNLIANPQDIDIHINFGEKDQISNNILEKGASSIAAAIYLEKKEVEINIMGNFQIAEKLFGIKIEEEIKDVKSDKLEQFDWVVNEHLLLQTWKNHDFIINKLQEVRYDENKTKYEEIIRIVPKDVWEDGTLMVKILEKFPTVSHAIPEFVWSDIDV